MCSHRHPALHQEGYLPMCDQNTATDREVLFSTPSVTLEADRETTPGMQHCLGPEHMDRYWCGAPRDPEKPMTWKDALECVVCADLVETLGPWWEPRV